MTNLTSVIAVALIAVYGCTRPQFIVLPAPDRPPTDVQANLDATWSAVIDQFARDNIPIETVEKASGLIVARPVTIDGSVDALALATCDLPQMPVARAAMAYYNVVVRPAGSNSSVRAFARFVTANGNQCNTTDRFEKNLEAAVKAAAERR